MPTDQPIVSVIVPAYNVERFLDQALASAEGQTLRDIEIICVNDGSTDNTLALLGEHAARDSRVRVIDKPNGGYGSACNRGIEAARGEWVAILEPDDWIEPTMYEDMVKFAASFDVPIDIVKTPYWRIVDPDTPGQRKLNCSYKGRIRPRRQPFTMADDHVDHLLIHHPSIWSALYRRSFLAEFDIKVHEIPGAGWADNPFMVETLCQARSIAYLDRAYYCYREETAEKSGSFVKRNADVPFERWHDMMDELERLGVSTPSVLKAQFRRGFTYLDYIGESISLDDASVHEAMGRMFARMDDDLVFSEPHIPPVWKKRYQETKGIEPRRINPVPYAVTLLQAAAYSLENVGPAETFNLVGSIVKRDKAAESAGASIVVDEVGNGDDGSSVALSVVIPVYDSERYLDECLYSLAAQTHADFEVVCVDDGSTDSSRDLLEKHAQRDKRIRIVTQPNGGPSSARNTGIRAATGKYVVFLDSDDILEPDACRILVQAVSGDAPDIVAFGWKCFPEGRANRWLVERTTVRNAYYPWFEPELLFSEMTNPYLRVAVRRSLIQEQGIAFDENLRVGEDCAFLFALFPRSRSTQLISDRLYRYRMPHAGSIMSLTTEGSPEKCLDDLLMAISIFGDWNRSGLIKQYGRYLMHWFMTMQLYTALRLPTPVRDDVVALVRQLWLAHFTEDELLSLHVPAHDRSLIELVLAADDDGTLNASGRALRKTLLAWRISEYGYGDLIRTALERLTRPRG